MAIKHYDFQRNSVFLECNRSLGNGVHENGVRNRCPHRRCGVDTEIPYRLPFWREFCWVLPVCVASGVDTNASALHRGQNPQNREKRVSGSKNSHFPNAPEKGDLSQTNPIFLVEPCRKMGIFFTQIALLWGIGKWEFFDPETLFSRFWGF